MRLIDANALLSSICGCFNVMEAQGIDMTTARAIVISIGNHAPAVDAVPVLRCKNCKMWNTEWKHEAGDCYCYKFFQFTDPDFFCAAGERRDTDDTPPD